MSRPYLIVPKLVEQPTWGGSYIVRLKGWEDDHNVPNKKIGQSYELYSASLLAENVFDSSDWRFGSEEHKDKIKVVLISEMIPFKKKPLLIKLTQAMGNSFQLHIKPKVKDPKWKPKPESWYFLEDGCITLGVKDNVSIDQYKETCLTIDAFVNEMGKKVQKNEILINDARERIKKFISDRDPHEFVQSILIKKHSFVDLSAGGLHHSWEEDMKSHPNGNVVFEVQEEATDNESTIRCFDQGKILDDGTVRPMNVVDYFTHLDASPEANNPKRLIQEAQNQSLIKTPYYSLALLAPRAEVAYENVGYSHLFVRDGHVEVVSGGVSVFVSTGHSCIVPESSSTFTIKPLKEHSIVIQTKQL